jgi:malate permease and related proteins
MFEQRAIESIAILIAVIFLGSLLRYLGVVKESHSKLLADLITKVTIPALIFSSLSSANISFDKIMLAGVMVVSQLLCAALAYFASRIMKLSKPKSGALILASTFPSSAFLGYAVVKEIFGNNSNALADAAIVSEIGVAMLLFTLGIFIAIHFGNPNQEKGYVKKEVLGFLYSPIFIALILGIAFSFVKIPKENLFAQSFYGMLQLISNANSFLVALTLGVMLKFKRINHVLGIVAVAVIIKLIVQPLLSYLQSKLFDFNHLWQEIVVLEASMPSAAMAAIFAKKYGEDSDLISIIIFATLISSCLSMIMMVVLIR